MDAILRFFERRGSAATAPVVLTLTAIICAVSAVATVAGCSVTGLEVAPSLAFAVAIPAMVAPPALYIFCQLVVRLAEARAQLTELVRTDPLTNALNRRGLEHVLTRHFESGENFFLLAIDIDNFKSINDSFGHEGGDEAIVVLARRLSSRFGHEFCGRWAGDEFCAAFFGSDPAKALEAARLFCAEVATRPVHFGEQSFFISISVGLALRAEEDEDWRAMQRRADGALYESKAGGRNRASLPAAKAA